MGMQYSSKDEKNCVRCDNVIYRSEKRRTDGGMHSHFTCPTKLKENIMSEDIEKAIKALTDAMQDTELGSYAHSWHCNIAMSVYDECTDDISHEDAHRIGNAAASRFMKLLFGVETKNK